MTAPGGLRNTRSTHGVGVPILHPDRARILPADSADSPPPPTHPPTLATHIHSYTNCPDHKPNLPNLDHSAQGKQAPIDARGLGLPQTLGATSYRGEHKSSAPTNTEESGASPGVPCGANTDLWEGPAAQP